MRRPTFAVQLGIVLGLGFVLKLVYVLTQAKYDPMFSLPLADGSYYVEWAEALATGQAGPGAGHPNEIYSAFYLAPLYPLLLSLFVRVFETDFGLLYYLQQIGMTAAAGMLAFAVRPITGDRAAVATAVLFTLYHPLLFFAARPLGEPLALLLLTASLLAATTLRGVASPLVAGALVGLASLARPNLLLVPLVWCARDLRRADWGRAALLLGAVVAAILPVTVRNFDVSGHVVPVSANSGMTLYHGNGPGGVDGHTPGISARLSNQQRDATRLASFWVERELDPVEADGWWREQAIRARLAEPWVTAGMLSRRLLFLVSNTELSLDYAPDLDVRPWRWLGPVGFWLILGLAGAGVAGRGFERSGGWTVWGALLACVAMPLIFYVNTRYRLPVAALLCVPAGAGLVALVDRTTPVVRRRAALLALVLLAALSWLAPVTERRDMTEAVFRANRAARWMDAGKFEQARADLDRAFEQDPDSVPAVLVMRALARRAGYASEFKTYLDKALATHPVSEQLRWEDVVLARVAADDFRGAQQAIHEAATKGITVDPEMTRRVEAGVEARAQRRMKERG